MIKIASKLKTLSAATCLTLLGTFSANAHPHVFIEASMEIVRNDKGEFSELRHVWRFDEIFSSTLVLDFDENANGKLDEAEIKIITDTVKESIAEYDFYTALRADKKVIEFYPPKELNGYMDGGKMIMFLAIEPVKPHSFKDGPLRISASDTSYYVAFEMKQENMKLTGPAPEACETTMTHPDFDKLYAENSQTLSEAFFKEDGETPINLGDEFYSWASVSCS